jgi:hypothetical protein
VANPVIHQLESPRSLDDLSRDELIELLEQGHEGRITIDFKNKTNARHLARRVRPRIMRTVKKYSAGSESDQANDEPASCVLRRDHREQFAAGRDKPCMPASISDWPRRD